MIWLNRLIYNWKQRRIIKRLIATTYPVVIIEYPSGRKMVLLRSLVTHQHGGWLRNIGWAAKRFGPMIYKLKVIPSTIEGI